MEKEGQKGMLCRSVTDRLMERARAAISVALLFGTLQGQNPLVTSGDKVYVIDIQHFCLIEPSAPGSRS